MGKSNTNWIEDERLIEKKIVAGVAVFGHSWTLMSKDKTLAFPKGIKPDDIRRKWKSMLEDYPDLLGKFKVGDEIPDYFKLPVAVVDKGKGSTALDEVAVAVADKGKGTAQAEGSGLNWKDLMEIKVDTVIKDVGELSKTQENTKKAVESVSVDVKEIHQMLKQLCGPMLTAEGNEGEEENKNGSTSE